MEALCVLAIVKAAGGRGEGTPCEGAESPTGWVPLRPGPRWACGAEAHRRPTLAEVRPGPGGSHTRARGALRPARAACFQNPLRFSREPVLWASGQGPGEGGTPPPEGLCTAEGLHKSPCKPPRLRARPRPAGGPHSKPTPSSSAGLQSPLLPGLWAVELPRRHRGHRAAVLSLGPHGRSLPLGAWVKAHPGAPGTHIQGAPPSLGVLTRSVVRGQGSCEGWQPACTPPRAYILEGPGTEHTDRTRKDPRETERVRGAGSRPEPACVPRRSARGCAGPRGGAVPSPEGRSGSLPELHGAWPKGPAGPHTSRSPHPRSLLSPRLDREKELGDPAAVPPASPLTQPPQEPSQRPTGVPDCASGRGVCTGGSGHALAARGCGQAQVLPGPLSSDWSEARLFFSHTMALVMLSCL